MEKVTSKKLMIKINKIIEWIPFFSLLYFCYFIYDGFYFQTFLLTYLLLFLIPIKKIPLNFKLITFFILIIITIPLLHFYNYYIFSILGYYCLTFLFYKNKFIFSFFYLLPFIIYLFKPGLIILWFAYFQMQYFLW